MTWEVFSREARAKYEKKKKTVCLSAFSDGIL
jgi:hypothetical protein